MKTILILLLSMTAALLIGGGLWFGNGDLIVAGAVVWTVVCGALWWNRGSGRR